MSENKDRVVFKFKVNGQEYTVDKKMKLMGFLRDELKLTSVKNGCAQGACGACMVIVDGKAQKACVLSTDKISGKDIVTVEGFTQREKDVYSYSFASCGAVQCGFCTPGMMISAKALIDKNNNPTSQEIKDSIKNNICRCTGYVKIEKAIFKAAKMIRENIAVPKENASGIGENILRVDAIDKALGKTKYVDDIVMDGMLYGSAVRSEYPRAIVKSIDVSEAKALDGVVDILTAKDIPGKQKIGHLKKDWDVMIPIGSITHYLGDSIALVVAENKEILNKAKKLVKVEYEVLEPVLNPDEALKDGAQLVHSTGNIVSQEHLIRGDADEAIKNSAYSVTNTYFTPWTEHAFLEPECAIAFPDENETITVYSSDQGVYQTRGECAEMLGVEPEKIRVIAKAVGGGFGGREDMTVQHHAVLLAYHTKRPVKVLLSRDESLLVHPKRHSMKVEMTTACDENGILTAMKAVVVSDSGAYASLGGPVLQRACTHAAGPYNYNIIDILGTAVYTNNPPAGAFRGFGVPQTCFATECNINELARKVGISPWEIRYKNALEPGNVMPNGQIADKTTAIKQTLMAVKEEFDKNPKVGIACAIKNSGLGVGVPDTGRCLLKVIDGTVHIRTSAACIGQGLGTTMIQIASTTIGLGTNCFVHDAPDTLLAPNSGNTTASRQTVFTGEATKRAANKLKEELSKLKLKNLKLLEGKEFYGEYTAVTDKLGTKDKENPISHVAYSYATQLVELDGNGKLKRVIAAHDVGKAINPQSVEGQIEGGVVMSLGYALSENYPLKDGKPTAKFGTLGLFKSTQVPNIEVKIIETGETDLANGAKGIGEIASIPTAPAVQLAYYNYDGVNRMSLPLENTPYEKKKKINK